MKKLLFIAILCQAFVIYSCKSNKDKATTEQEQTAPVTAGSVTSSPETNGDEATSKRWEARKAKGDTIALPYKELQAFLPDISGFTKEEGAKGSQMNVPGMGSWSQAEQEYKSGEKQATITIFDYNSAWQAFQGLTAMYSMGYSFEDDSRKQSAVNLGVKDVAAYQTIEKKDNRSELVLVVADRFIINIKADGDSDGSMVTSIAKSMKLGELASK
jgi:hypothetical protein